MCYVKKFFLLSEVIAGVYYHSASWNDGEFDLNFISVLLKLLLKKVNYYKGKTIL